MRPAWLSARRRGEPRVWHRSQDCAARRHRRHHRAPEQVTEAAARKVARLCLTCAGWPA